MPSLIQNLRALPKPVWILFAGTFINRFGSFVMPFLAIYMKREGYTPTQAGLAVGAYGAGHIMAAMIGGHLADRIGRRHTIALSMFSSAAAMLALSQVHTLPLMLTLTFVTGMLTEIYRPAATALIGDLVQPEQRVAAFGMYRFAINLGFAAGPITAGLLAEHSFFYVFAGDALTSFLYGIVAMVALPHGVRATKTERESAEGFRVALRVALNNRRFVYFLMATLCFTLVEFQVLSTFPLHVVNLGYSEKTYGLLMGMNGIMIVLIELAITAWTQRFPPQPLIALGYGLTGIGFAMTGIADNLPYLAFTVIVWTTAEMLHAPMAGAYVTGLAPERYRGRYMGLWHSMWSAGMLLGPVIGMALYERSPNALWVACLVMGVLAAGLALIKPRLRGAEAQRLREARPADL